MHIPWGIVFRRQRLHGDFQLDEPVKRPDCYHKNYLGAFRDRIFGQLTFDISQGGLSVLSIQFLPSASSVVSNRSKQLRM